MTTTGELRQPAVSEFIVRCIESAGGATEFRTPTVLDVLLPPGLTYAAGDRPLVSLALNPDPQSARTDTEPATIGSPFVDTLIEYASGRGTTAVGRLEPGVLKRKGLRDVFERDLVFSNCRVRFDDGSVRIHNMYYAVFEFRLTFVSDERRERLVTVPVDLWLNRANHALARDMTRRQVLPTDAPENGAISHTAIHAAYDVAKEAVRERAKEESLVHQARVLKRFEVEQARISSYYDQIVRDLEHRSSAESDDAKRGAFRAKVASARAEADAKLREIAEKYRIVPRAALANARIIGQEKTFFRLAIDRGSITREMELSYDSLLERLDLPSCEQCGQPTARLHVTDTAQRICPNCRASA